MLRTGTSLRAWVKTSKRYYISRLSRTEFFEGKWTLLEELHVEVTGSSDVHKAPMCSQSQVEFDAHEFESAG